MRIDYKSRFRLRNYHCNAIVTRVGLELREQAWEVLIERNRIAAEEDELSEDQEVNDPYLGLYSLMLFDVDGEGVENNLENNNYRVDTWEGEEKAYLSGSDCLCCS